MLFLLLLLLLLVMVALGWKEERKPGRAACTRLFLPFSVPSSSPTLTSHRLRTKDYQTDHIPTYIPQGLCMYESLQSPGNRPALKANRSLRTEAGINKTRPNSGSSLAVGAAVTESPPGCLKKSPNAPGIRRLRR